MDSGSYNNIRRGAMPPSSLAPNASSYKANVNRTKTRKWVEAKVQSYDGDDWGNDYDDYDDGDDQQNEPEPPPLTSRLAGLRPVGQSSQQLPSLRTFSQPASASLPSNSGVQAFGPSVLRVQTQPIASTVLSPPYATESAHPSTVRSSHASLPSGPYSAGPVPARPRFPPRKSSMSQNDQSDSDDKIATNSEFRPDSGSGNRPLVDQQSVSSSGAPPLATKTLPLVRPSDIYKKMGEEKDKDRLSMALGRPSQDSIPSRAEASSPPNQLRPAGEQSIQTVYDGSKSASFRDPILAPVAEQERQYTGNGFFASAQTSQSPAIYEPTPSNRHPPPTQNEPNDELKTDLLKSRRFSTSPQLPNLSRMSGFGDDFFPSSGGFGSRTGSKLITAEEEPRPISSEINPNMIALQGGDTGKLGGNPELDPPPTANDKVDGIREGFSNMAQSQSSDIRPQLPGGWVSESTTAPLLSERPTPLEQPEGQSPTRLSNIQGISVSPLAESDVEPSETNLASADMASLPSIDSDCAPNSTGVNEPGLRLAGSAGEHPFIYPSPSPLKTRSLLANSPPKSASPVSLRDQALPMQTSLVGQPAPTATTGSGFSPTAPLNPGRAQANQPDFILPSIHEHQGTISTIETASPEKESDKLREEIIKSLSPAPASPDPGGVQGRDNSDSEPIPGSLTRESSYLAGVYDEYLAAVEEKTLHSEKPTYMTARAPAERESEPTAELQDTSTPQPAPLSSAKSFAPENATKLRRFSWQNDPEDMSSNSARPEPARPIHPQEVSVHGAENAVVGSNTDISVVSPMTDSLQGESGVTGMASQVSQISSRIPEDTSTATIESPSPISFVAARRPNPAHDESNTARLSLADEKEMVLIGDAQSTTSSAPEQHPALVEAPEQAGDSAPPGPRPASTDTLTSFREILNLATCEERVQKFDETREQFYVMDSGLSNWLAYLQGQPDHADEAAMGNTSPLLSKLGVQPATIGAAGAPPVPHKPGGAASHSRRMSIGNVQQLMAAQTTSFGASGNQVGTKSKELLHAAGVFGNKGVKSGMKLFNKGKNKLRERAAGDKAFF